MPAPTESGSDRAQLSLRVDGIPFPYWHHTVGWRTQGQRVDSLDGRRVVTVFYTGAKGSRVGYAIVSGSPVPVSGGTKVWRHGIRYTLINVRGGRVVTWERKGHTCVIAGRRVNDKTLLALASAESGPATAA
jgi:hypothetical protein